MTKNLIQTQLPKTAEPTPGAGGMGWVGNANAVIKAWENDVRTSFAAAVSNNTAGSVPMRQGEIDNVVAALNAHTARSIELYPGRMDHGKSLIESDGQLYTHESGMGPGGSILSKWAKVVGSYQLPEMPMY